MVKKEILNLVLLTLVIVLLMGLYTIGSDVVSSKTLQEAEKGDIVEFYGMCVKAKDSYSVLFNGKESIVVFERLNVSQIYEIKGKLYQEKGIVPILIKKAEKEKLNVTKIKGAIWWKNNKCYLLTPKKIYLQRCLEIEKGKVIEADGIIYDDIFYPIFYREEDYLKNPMDGMPYKINGTVLYGGNPATIWKNEKIKVYLPYKVTLKEGQKVEILGIADLKSTLTLYVSSQEDVKLLNNTEVSRIGNERVGDIVSGTCQVIKSSRFLKLNCTKLRFYGFNANVGDIIKFKALRRENSLYCLSCSIKIPRRSLENSICAPKKGIIKVHGQVKEVKIYKNGFELANITYRNCSILLKLRKSLNIAIAENQTITAFGYYTTYRGKPALEVQSREDICLENCS